MNYSDIDTLFVVQNSTLYRTGSISAHLNTGLPRDRRLCGDGLIIGEQHMTSALSRHTQKIAAVGTALAAVLTAPPICAQSAAENSLTAGYDSGFFIKDASGDNALYVNGLFQPRLNHFETKDTAQFGAVDQSSNNFDIFLGRIYFSGNVMNKSITYFVTLQGTTTGNGSGVTLLDAVVAKAFSPYLKVEVGRYWSAYTYEYNDDIAKYLLPDLSAAEWAFSLGRQTGMRFSGKAGDLSYRLSVSNPIPGSDVGNTENLHSKLATILNLEYDILQPYGYQETNPSPAGVAKPELSLWASAMYNPVDYSSVFQNNLAGDITDGATASLNFRYAYFTLQGSGYYKNTQARPGAHAAFSSHGWQEQAGYYLVPGKLEVVQRVDGVKWGLGQIPVTGGTSTQWYAGPANFSYRDLTEYTGGLNYYIGGHRVKTQLQYSHLSGAGFNNRSFSADRVIFQAQLAF